MGPNNLHCVSSSMLGRIEGWAVKLEHAPHLLIDSEAAPDHEDNLHQLSVQFRPRNDFTLRVDGERLDTFVGELIIFPGILRKVNSIWPSNMECGHVEFHEAGKYTEEAAVSGVASVGDEYFNTLLQIYLNGGLMPSYVSLDLFGLQDDDWLISSFPRLGLRSLSMSTTIETIA